MRTYRQDSDDTRLYDLNWSDQLASDTEITGVSATISSSAWSVASGLTGAGATVDGKYTYIKLSGGTVNTTYKVENEITTSGGLTHTKSFQVQVVVK
jgi:hypothetical protein